MSLSSCCLKLNSMAYLCSWLSAISASNKFAKMTWINLTFLLELLPPKANVVVRWFKPCITNTMCLFIRKEYPYLIWQRQSWNLLSYIVCGNNKHRLKSYILVFVHHFSATVSLCSNSHVCQEYLKMYKKENVTLAWMQRADPRIYVLHVYTIGSVYLHYSWAMVADIKIVKDRAKHAHTGVDCYSDPAYCYKTASSRQMAITTCIIVVELRCGTHCHISIRQSGETLQNRNQAFIDITLSWSTNDIPVFYRRCWRSFNLHCGIVGYQRYRFSVWLSHLLLRSTELVPMLQKETDTLTVSENAFDSMYATFIIGFWICCIYCQNLLYLNW